MASTGTLLDRRALLAPEDQLASIVPPLNSLVERMWFGQLDLPTPCARFSVHDLLDHVIVLGGRFASMFRGQPVADVPPPTVYGWVPAEEFTATTLALLDAVRSPGAMERTIDSPLGAMPGETFARFVALDALVHGWDLATAVGVAWCPPVEVVESVDAFARLAITTELRDAGAFAAPAAPPPGVGPLQRLIAFTGRTL